MTDPKPQPAPVRRRRFALSVRGLMILVLLIGGTTGWKARRASLQKRAVAAIGRLGGDVEYDWMRRWNEGSDDGVNSTPMPNGPAVPRWLRRLAGDEYFQEVVAVGLPMGCRGTGGPETPEEEKAERRAMAAEQAAREADQLACLDGLDRLETLSLDFETLTPAAFDRVARLGRLKTLFVDGVDARVATGLGRLTNLEALTVHPRYRETTPDGDLEYASFPFGFLEGMTRLRELTIDRGSTGLDELRLKSLKRLSKLRQLNLTFRDGPIPNQLFEELRRAIPGLEVEQW